MKDLTFYGIPKGKYFELFAGEHPSEKIYSVQVKQWFNFFPDVPAAVNVLVPEYPNGEDGKLYVAYQENHVVMNWHGEHLRVRPSLALVGFMASRGIDLPEYVWINPYAFRWMISKPQFVMDNWRENNFWL